ncbi:MAG: hypothetical protein KF687_10960 [Cyclobacteriaceae bacterium]|nr:hypothetical protein [Cyclobacteriaceae bacterium]
MPSVNIGWHRDHQNKIMSMLLNGVFSMEWTTAYITGNGSFKDEVLKNLNKSNFPFMPGSPESDNLYLLWVDDRQTIRDLKKAIGSKTVLKYRLQVFQSLEKYFENLRDKNQSVNFTPQEEALIRSMTNPMEYKNSA